jgi:S-adenosylmethionine/arginine decarboxylase-like enzyme
MAFDHFEQITMPWLIVATVDAFTSGDTFERAKALKWLERTLDDDSISASDVHNNWWRAEILYSLNYSIK